MVDMNNIIRYLVGLIAAATISCSEPPKFVESRTDKTWTHFKYEGTLDDKLAISDEFDEMDQKKGNHCDNTGDLNVYSQGENTYIKARCGSQQKKFRRKKRKGTKRKKKSKTPRMRALGYPMDPATTRITSRYRTGHRPGHDGIDISSKVPGKCEGMPVYAAEKGRILAACPDGQGNKNNGNYVKIKHPNGFSTIYIHLSKLNVPADCKGRKKMKVKKGQTIGYCGNTGNSKGAHLHYEIRKNGRHINPLK